MALIDDDGFEQEPTQSVSLERENMNTRQQSPLAISVCLLRKLPQALLNLEGIYLRSVELRTDYTTISNHIVPNQVKGRSSLALLHRKEDLVLTRPIDTKMPEQISSINVEYFQQGVESWRTLLTLSSTAQA